jgi:hypothetical protein
MKIGLVPATALVVALSLPLLAQRPGEGQRPAEPRGETQRPAEMQRPAEPGHGVPHANQGRIPSPPPKREPRAKPEPQRPVPGRMNNTPHVANDHWYGHDKPNDARYRLARPFEHGHFEHFGPSYHYNVVRIDQNLHRFWLPDGYFFDIAPWDWPLVADWCWNCGDDFVIYDDPDHPGWYLLYNIHTGAYVHVQYMGS